MKTKATKSAAAATANALPLSLMRAFTRAKVRIDASGKVRTTLPPALHRNRFRVIEAARHYLRRESAADFTESVVGLMLATENCSEAVVTVDYEPEYDDNGGAFMSCSTRMEFFDGAGDEVLPESNVCDDPGEYLQNTCDYGFLEREPTQYRFSRKAVDALLVDGNYAAFLADGAKAAATIEAITE